MSVDINSFDESLGLLASIEQTVHQQGKNNRGNHGIEAITLANEVVNQECNACNGRRDEKYQSQLNHAASAESQGIVAQPPRRAANSRTSAESTGW